jgi:HEAT repeat protein
VLLLSASLAGCAADVATPRSGVPQADRRNAAEAARAKLYEAANSPDGAVRCRALEALALTQGQAAGSALGKALDDPAPAVQFAAAMGIGDCQHLGASEKLRKMAESPDVSPSVQCAVVYALHGLGDDTRMNRLATFLMSGGPEARANAALVMAKIGHPSAVKPLRSQLENETHPGVRLQLVESLAALGEPRSYSLLRAYARAGDPYERMLAVQALGRTRDSQAKGLLVWAFGAEQPPPLRLVAAGGLARMGDHRGWNLAVEAVQKPADVARQSFKGVVALSKPQEAQLQLLGALALGQMNRPEAVDVLLPLLSSEDPTCRAGAAKSILMLLAESPESASSAISRDSALVARGASPAVAPAAATTGTPPAASPAEPAIRAAPPRE